MNGEKTHFHTRSGSAMLPWVVTVCVAFTAFGDEPATKAPSEPATTREQYISEIVKKNIFTPARKPKRPVYDPASAATAIRDTGPRDLKRPFVVKGITQIGSEAQAFLYFKDPSEYRTVKAGDIIETIKIEKIESNHLICDYSGRQVQIAVDESSGDALARLVGLGRSSGYYLIGTTVQPEDSFALFNFPGEARPRKLREGDMLGSERQVFKIEPGKVILLDQDGDKITVEAGPPPKR